MLWPLLDRAQVFAAVNHLLPAETAPAAPQLDLLFATAEAFRGHLDTTFLVWSQTGAHVPVRLVTVAERPRTANLDQFSLHFHAPEGAADLNGTHAFAHPSLGQFDLFIGAVGPPTAGRVVYEACLSRMVSHA